MKNEKDPLKSKKLPVSLNRDELAAFTHAADKLGLKLSTFLKVAALYWADHIERTGTAPVRPDSVGIKRDADASTGIRPNAGKRKAQ